MDLMQAIVMRRAVREYNDMPVEQARIEQCIHAASLAPSAMNRQPWAFAVLTDPERIVACHVCPYCSRQLVARHAHFVKAVHCGEPQIVTKRSELAQDLAVLLVVVDTLFLARVCMERGFHNTFFRMTMFRDALKARFKRAQLREAILVFGDSAASMRPANSSLKCHINSFRF
jgi:nitroreductase